MSQRMSVLPDRKASVVTNAATRGRSRGSLRSVLAGETPGKRRETVAADSVTSRVRQEEQERSFRKMANAREVIQIARGELRATPRGELCDTQSQASQNHRQSMVSTDSKPLQVAVVTDSGINPDADTDSGPESYTITHQSSLKAVSEAIIKGTYQVQLKNKVGDVFYCVGQEMTSRKKIMAAAKEAMQTHNWEVFKVHCQGTVDELRAERELKGEKVDFADFVENIEETLENLKLHAGVDEQCSRCLTELQALERNAAAHPEVMWHKLMECQQIAEKRIQSAEEIQHALEFIGMKAIEEDENSVVAPEALQRAQDLLSALPDEKRNNLASILMSSDPETEEVDEGIAKEELESLGASDEELYIMLAKIRRTAWEGSCKAAVGSIIGLSEVAAMSLKTFATQVEESLEKDEASVAVRPSDYKSVKCAHPSAQRKSQRGGLKQGSGRRKSVQKVVIKADREEVSVSEGTKHSKPRSDSPGTFGGAARFETASSQSHGGHVSKHVTSKQPGPGLQEGPCARRLDTTYCAVGNAKIPVYSAANLKSLTAEELRDHAGQLQRSLGNRLDQTSLPDDVADLSSWISAMYLNMQPPEVNFKGHAISVHPEHALLGMPLDTLLSTASKLSEVIGIAGPPESATQEQLVSWIMSTQSGHLLPLMDQSQEVGVTRMNSNGELPRICSVEQLRAMSPQSLQTCGNAWLEAVGPEFVTSSVPPDDAALIDWIVETQNNHRILHGRLVPIYNLQQLRAKPFETLRSHAAFLCEAIGHESVGSSVPTDDTKLLFWILKTQASHVTKHQTDINSKTLAIHTVEELRDKSPQSLRAYGNQLIEALGFQSIGSSVPLEDTQLIDWIVDVQANHLITRRIELNGTSVPVYSAQFLQAASLQSMRKHADLLLDAVGLQAIGSPVPGDAKLMEWIATIQDKILTGVEPHADVNANSVRMHCGGLHHKEAVGNSKSITILREEEIRAKSPQSARAYAEQVFDVIGFDSIGSPIPMDDTELIDWIIGVQSSHLGHAARECEDSADPNSVDGQHDSDEEHFQKDPTDDVGGLCSRTLKDDVARKWQKRYCIPTAGGQVLRMHRRGKDSAGQPQTIVEELLNKLSSALAATAISQPQYTSVSLDRTIMFSFSQTQQLHDWLGNGTRKTVKASTELDEHRRRNKRLVQWVGQGDTSNSEHTSPLQDVEIKEFSAKERRRSRKQMFKFAPLSFKTKTTLMQALAQSFAEYGEVAEVFLGESKNQVEINVSGYVAFRNASSAETLVKSGKLLAVCGETVSMRPLTKSDVVTWSEVAASGTLPLAKEPLHLTVAGRVHAALLDLQSIVRNRWKTVHKAAKFLSTCGGDFGGDGRIGIPKLHLELVLCGYSCSCAELCVLFRGLCVPCTEYSTLSIGEFHRLDKIEQWCAHQQKNNVHENEVLLGSLQLRRILIDTAEGPELLLTRLYITLATPDAHVGWMGKAESKIESLVDILNHFQSALDSCEAAQYAEMITSEFGLHLFVGVIGSRIASNAIHQQALTIIARAMEQHGGDLFAQQIANNGKSQRGVAVPQKAARAARTSASSKACCEIDEAPNDFAIHLTKNLWRPLVDFMDPIATGESANIEPALWRSVSLLFRQAQVPATAVGPHSARLVPHVCAALKKLINSVTVMSAHLVASRVLADEEGEGDDEKGTPEPHAEVLVHETASTSKEFTSGLPGPTLEASFDSQCPPPSVKSREGQISGAIVAIAMEKSTECLNQLKAFRLLQSIHEVAGSDRFTAAEVSTMAVVFGGCHILRVILRNATGEMLEMKQLASELLVEWEQERAKLSLRWQFPKPPRTDLTKMEALRKAIENANEEGFPIVWPEIYFKPKPKPHTPDGQRFSQSSRTASRALVRLAQVPAASKNVIEFPFSNEDSIEYDVMSRLKRRWEKEQKKLGLCQEVDRSASGFSSTPPQCSRPPSSVTPQSARLPHVPATRPPQKGPNTARGHRTPPWKIEESLPVRCGIFGQRSSSGRESALTFSSRGASPRWDFSPKASPRVESRGDVKLPSIALVANELF